MNNSQILAKEPDKLITKKRNLDHDLKQAKQRELNLQDPLILKPNLNEVDKGNKIDSQICWKYLRFGWLQIIAMITITRIIYKNTTGQGFKPQSVDDSQSSPFTEQKKINLVPSRRILKDHDLDQLLVYQKRGTKQRKDYFEQCAERAKNIQRTKKQRKREKLQAKILENNQSPNQQEKSKQKTSEDPQKQINKKQLCLPVQSKPQNEIKKLQIKQRTIYKYQYQQSEQGNEYKFPLVNTYYSENSIQFLETMSSIDHARQKLGKTINNTYINCDVKYFNWDLFIQQVGKFDVLIIDPPWRIKGAQKNDSQFMFSNCRFSLQYNTMSNHQIKQLPLHYISDQGFIFLWILNTQLNSSLQILQQWGYQLVQQIVWVKLRNQKVYLTHGYYFMHSYELCLVGYKNKRKDGKSMLLRHGINPNVIFGQVRKKSQKPQDIYSIIQMVFKGKKKIQIFARNHNLRFGIFSIGNQLGQAYDKWMLHLHCDDCKNDIKSKMKRYKSKIIANYDICQQCINNIQRNHNKQQFFQFANQVDQDIRHQYLNCNLCGVEPIWGIRFQCLTCMDYDLCQCCYDKYLSIKNDINHPQNVHPGDHQFRTLEVPVFGFGFAIHQYKCSSCYQNPIIGMCLSCTTCKNFKLCQKCFFERPRHQRMNLSKSHRHNHQFQAMFEPQFNQQKKYQCFNCKKQIIQNCYMCQNCYNFFFCQQCYQDRNKFKSLYANTHKKYHVFTKMF